MSHTHTHSHSLRHHRCKVESSRKRIWMMEKTCLLASQNEPFWPVLSQTQAELRLPGLGRGSVGTEPAQWSLEPRPPNCSSFVVSQTQRRDESFLGSKELSASQMKGSWQPQALPVNLVPTLPSHPKGPSALNRVWGGGQIPRRRYALGPALPP